jgi:prolipoprotein diacylglyceryltransferase
MHFLIIALCVYFLFFLYVVHVLSKDDFIIVRKDIEMEQIFNAALWTALVSLFFARLFYVIFNPNLIPKTLLGFLALPYFPGLYLAGAVLGGGFFIALYSSYKKLPVGRIFDFFALSFSIVLPFSLLGNALLLSWANFLLSLSQFVGFLVVAIVFLKIVFPRMQRNVLKEGSLGIFYLICLSVISFILNIILSWKKFGIFEKDNLLWILVLIISIVIIVKRELVEKSSSKK